jgi:predicted metal-dependent hydrolase
MDAATPPPPRDRHRTSDGRTSDGHTPDGRTSDGRAPDGRAPDRRSDRRTSDRRSDRRAPDGRSDRRASAGGASALERRAATPGRPALEIHRSARRRRSASAAARGDVVVVRLPAGLPGDEEERMIARLVDKVVRRVHRDRAGGDAALTRRAHGLADRYLDGVRPTAVRWSSRMSRQHGSCTPSTGEIRIGDHLAAMPDYVLDAVLVHELAHLVEPGHGPAFQALADRYPLRERARGYLEGHAAAQLAAGIPAEPDAAAGSSHEPDGAAGIPAEPDAAASS